MEEKLIRNQAPTTPLSRIGKVAISGYYDPVVRVTLQYIAAREQTSQQELLAEALNKLFESRGEPPVAKG